MGAPHEAAIEAPSTDRSQSGAFSATITEPPTRALSAFK